MPNDPTPATVACPNCGKPVSKRDEHFIDAERLGVDWGCTTAATEGYCGSCNCVCPCVCGCPSCGCWPDDQDAGR